MRVKYFMKLNLMTRLNESHGKIWTNLIPLVTPLLISYTIRFSFQFRNSRENLISEKFTYSPSRRRSQKVRERVPLCLQAREKDFVVSRERGRHGSLPLIFSLILARDSTRKSVLSRGPCWVNNARTVFATREASCVLCYRRRGGCRSPYKGWTL